MLLSFSRLKNVQIVSLLQPLTHYNFLGQNMAAEINDDSMAIMFMADMRTPGIKLICRPSYELQAAATGSPFDYPLSSRFDENDAISHSSVHHHFLSSFCCSCRTSCSQVRRKRWARLERWTRSETLYQLGLSWQQAIPFNLVRVICLLSNWTGFHNTDYPNVWRTLSMKVSFLF